MAKKKDNNMDGILALSKNEVAEELNKVEVELMELRLGLATKQEQNSQKLRDLRTQRARLKSRMKMLDTEQAPQTTKSES
ncbi:50S ribosomal protein L29 [Candidatus Peregrinibacteria bacterium CG11_big_fil_rev_8_21_14_0_20_46_8]|nr:MAG: 50S ribosomal protein L29 [Candidatus Peregrinibacteria bacterium CG11_big_fil_rev_8_21_14_0_20_46_8]